MKAQQRSGELTHEALDPAGLCNVHPEGMSSFSSSRSDSRGQLDTLALSHLEVRGLSLGDAAVSAACWASAVGAAACTAPGMPALTSELRAWIRDAASELEEGAADRRVARVAGLGGA